MRHKTEQWQQPCNHMVTTVEEYNMLSAFLEKHGILSRMIMIGDGMAEWQITNPYETAIKLFCSHDETCYKYATEEMKSRNWCI